MTRPGDSLEETLPTVAELRAAERRASEHDTGRAWITKIREQLVSPATQQRKEIEHDG